MTNWDRELQRLVEHGRDREAAALAAHRLFGALSLGGPMDPLEQFDLLGPVLGAVLASLSPTSLDEPTPCTDFSVRQVLGHMLGGATSFSAAYRGEPAPSSDAQPSSADPREQVDAALSGLRDALHSPGGMERTIDSPFGQVSGDWFARYIVLDGLVHGWDMATAAGLEYAPPGDLVSAVLAFARGELAPLMPGSGQFAAATTPPDDATPIEELVAFTGRAVRY